MKIKFIFLLFAIVIVSCKKTDNNPNIDSNLVGTWTWKLSSGGIAGAEYTPESTGETRTISFSSGGEYKMFLNGSLQFNSYFKTDIRIFYNTNEKYQVLLFNDLPFQIYRLPSSDSLILSDLAMDGFSYIYKRKQ